MGLYPNDTIMRNWQSFGACVVTILGIRVVLGVMALTIPAQTTWIYEDYWHHYYLGLIGLLFSLFFRFRFADLLRGVSLGLMIDEVMLPVYLLGFWPYGYWSAFNIVPTILAVVAYGLLIFLSKRETIEER